MRESKLKKMKWFAQVHSVHKFYHWHAHNAHVSPSSQPSVCFHFTAFAPKTNSIQDLLHQGPSCQPCTFLLIYTPTTYKKHCSLYFYLHCTLCVCMPCAHLHFGFLPIRRALREYCLCFGAFVDSPSTSIWYDSSLLMLPQSTCLFSLALELLDCRKQSVFSFVSIYLNVHATISPSSDTHPPM